MPKRVTVIASGETERRALPHLVAHLQANDIEIDVSIPPGNGKLTVSMAEKLIKLSIYAGPPPDKVVVLLDVDGKDPKQVLTSFRNGLQERLRNDTVNSILYAHAQWHLEAWYFGDAEGLRRYLGGDALGSIDTSQPDRIENPKLHFKKLLRNRNRLYTAQVSSGIAEVLDPETIGQRSPSFKGFLEAVQNGTSN